MRADRSTLSTRATKVNLIEVIKNIQVRRKRTNEKDAYILEEVEEKLNAILSQLDALEGRLL